MSRVCSHAPFEPIATKFCMWVWVGDVITDAKFYRNQLRGFGVARPPKRHFLYLMFITVTTVSALQCCTVITVLCIVVVICCRSSSCDVIVGLRCRALSCVVVVRHRRPASSSYIVSAHLVTRCVVVGELHRMLLRVVVIVSCHCTL